MTKSTIILDFIIIGQGIAGTCLSHLLEEGEYNFLVFDAPAKNNCSSVAAGLINPVTGRLLSKTWKAKALLDYSMAFYKKIEKKLENKFLFEKEIIRPAVNTTQVNDTLGKISDGYFEDFLDFNEKDSYLEENIHIPYGYYKIKHGGYLDVKTFLESARHYFIEKKLFHLDWISEHEVVKHHDYWEVKGIKTKRIIWCTGHYQTSNSYFDYLPFALTKGELFNFSSKKLTTNYIFNKNFFVVPKGNKFVAGATYSKNVEETTTKEGISFMLEKLNGIIKTNFNVTSHYYGIRPTVKDRKPFLGEHPDKKNCFIFNGLGSKGVTLGPYFANELLNFILFSKQLEKETDILRYKKTD